MRPSHLQPEPPFGFAPLPPGEGSGVKGPTRDRSAHSASIGLTQRVGASRPSRKRGTVAWLAASLTALALYPVHSQADGIVQSLPEDGRWARFDLEREHIGADGEAVKTSTGTLTVSSVGTKTVDG